MFFVLTACRAAEEEINNSDEIELLSTSLYEENVEDYDELEPQLTGCLSKSEGSLLSAEKKSGKTVTFAEVVLYCFLKIILFC